MDNRKTWLTSLKERTKDARTHLTTSAVRRSCLGISLSKIMLGISGTSACRRGKCMFRKFCSRLNGADMNGGAKRIAVAMSI